MEDKSEEEIIKNAQDKLLEAKNAVRKIQETPLTQALTPEAREDATKVAREVWVASMKLLGDKDYVVRADPTKVKGNLTIYSKNSVEQTTFAGADLGMSRYSYDNDTANQIQYITQELWHFYPDHVQKTIRHHTQTFDGETLAPRGLAIEKIETNRDELANLLADIKSSIQFKPKY